MSRRATTSLQKGGTPVLPVFHFRRCARTEPASAFSLVELLVVIAIIAVLSTFSVVAFTNVMRSSELTAGAKQLEATISLARIHALTMGRVVELRFYQSVRQPEGDNVAREVQTFSIADGTNQPVAIRPPQRLSESVAIFPQWSTLLSTPLIVDSNRPDRSYWAIRIRPDARAELAPYPTNDTWYVSVASITSRAGAAPPANFAVVAIDPINSITRVSQP